MALLLFSIFLQTCKRNGDFSPKQLSNRQNISESAKHTYTFWPNHMDPTFKDTAGILVGYPKNTKSGETFVPAKGAFQVHLESLSPESFKIHLSLQIETVTTQFSILNSELDSKGVIDSLLFVHSGIAQPLRLRCQNLNCELIHLCFPNRFRDYVYCSSSFRFKKMPDEKFSLANIRNAFGSSQMLTPDNLASSLPDALLLDDCPETDHQCLNYLK